MFFKALNVSFEFFLFLGEKIGFGKVGSGGSKRFWRIEEEK